MIPPPLRPSTCKWLCLVSLLLLGLACRSSSEWPSAITLVEEFRAARTRGDLDTARSYLTENPRRWFEERSGEGTPWVLGDGPWKHWDEHFHSESRLGELQTDGDRVWVDVTEINDYLRLVDRGASRYRLTWFIEEGRISGSLIESLEPSSAPRGRTEELLTWARANEPEEIEALMPGGRIDPSGDHPERMRALLERWRAAEGLPAIGDSGRNED